MALSIHFLNVGHGDCTIIKHPSGRLTVIDINNGIELDATSAEELTKAYGLADLQRLFTDIRTDYAKQAQPDSARRLRALTKAAEQTAGQALVQKGYTIPLTNPIQFLDDHYNGEAVHRYIQTHPDMDHMRGISALVGCREIVNVWDTEHNKDPEKFYRDGDEEDWQTYQDLSAGKQGTLLHLYRGSTGDYYNQDSEVGGSGDSIEILSPTPEIITAANAANKPNNLSYVLRITCQGFSIILGGDAEQEVWQDLVDRYGTNLRCSVLKASHHGRDSGYHQEAVKLMSPSHTIVSVGAKPDTDATSKYRQYSTNVWSTRWKGNIQFTINEDGTGVIDSDYNR